MLVTRQALRSTLLLEPLQGRLGQGIATPAGWHEKFWHHDPFAGGGYTALPKRAFVGTLPLQSTPIDKIHWAGSEYASDHPGYIDGAIESGTTAAEEVLATLLGNIP